MFKEIYPDLYFTQTEKEKNEKFFLYSDRDIVTKDIKYKGKVFKLQEPNDIDVPGQIENPSHSIEKSLGSSYEWSFLKRMYCNGFLLCFLDFFPSPNTDIKQLKFKVYQLNEISNN